MKRPSPSILLTLVVALALLAGATVYFVTRARDTGTPAPAAAGGDRKILYWTDPMTPSYRSDKPGKSPFMDMELVPVYAEPQSGTTAGIPVVTIAPQVLNLLATYRAAAQPEPCTDDESPLAKA